VDPLILLPFWLDIGCKLEINDTQNFKGIFSDISEFLALL
jgi:hypothetical protein